MATCRVGTCRGKTTVCKRAATLTAAPRKPRNDLRKWNFGASAALELRSSGTSSRLSKWPPFCAASIESEFDHQKLRQVLPDMPEYGHALATGEPPWPKFFRSEEHTSELQS